MATGGIVYYRTAERPDLRFWLLDDDGVLVNLTGYTFTFKLGAPGSAATFTKTSGITGAAGSGTETSGVPNVVIQFTAGELDALTKTRTTWQIRATSGAADRIWQGPFELKDVVA